MHVTLHFQSRISESAIERNLSLMATTACDRRLRDFALLLLNRARKQNKIEKHERQYSYAS